MKLWQGIPMIVLLMALPTMWACAPQSEISSDEVIAIVEKYEVGEWGKGVDAQGRTYYGMIGGAGHGVGGKNEEWEATYKGKGHWFVTCYQQTWWQDPSQEALHSWDYYESSGIIDYKGVQVRQR